MISDTGFWNLEGDQFDNHHVYDCKLAEGLVLFAKSLDVKKSYDFGCGHGKYVEKFRSQQIEASGFDGNPVTSKIPNCSVKDLTSDFQLDPVDFLLCLEVCEHVPKKFEDALLKTIDRHVNPKGTLVLSWAIVGQAGLGHVNCQNNDYVISKFISMGYSYNEVKSKELRSNVSAWWFRNTVLVFTKNS